MKNDYEILVARYVKKDIANSLDK